MTQTIPVMHCFNNDYVIPAAVAFHSMLEHANPKYQYKLYVLHSDITEGNQDKLHQEVAKFSNASLEFIDMRDKFKDLFDKTQVKAHFSKEMFYKFLPASLFPQYDKIIVSDVDVVYLGDISLSYFSFDADEDFYFAGIKAAILKDSWIQNFIDNYKRNFSDEEFKKIKTCGGYYVFNLKKLRQDDMEQKFIEYVSKNAKRLIQPEQDAINICCYPKIKDLSLNYVACSYLYDIYKAEEDFDNDQNYSKEELKDAMANPIQLHYATHVKPWNTPACTKAEEWFKVLTKTEFLKDYLASQSKEESPKIISKTICHFQMKVSKSKTICLELTRIKD